MNLVVLMGDRAYQRMKPVTTDFSTVRRREDACEREARLDTRLPPESYLFVAYLFDLVAGAPYPVVIMRRCSDALRLASMVPRGELVDRMAWFATTLAVVDVVTNRRGRSNR